LIIGDLNSKFNDIWYKVLKQIRVSIYWQCSSWCPLCTSSCSLWWKKPTTRNTKKSTRDTKSKNGIFFCQGC